MVPPPPVHVRARGRLPRVLLALLLSGATAGGLAGSASATRGGPATAGVVPQAVTEAVTEPVTEPVTEDPTRQPDPEYPVPEPPDPDADPPDYRFLSTPDFLNLDVGDVSDVHGWDAADPTVAGSADDPNSINESYATALDVVMDAFVAEQPDDVLVAGDLVEGHWGIDTGATGIFGPTDTFQHRTGHVRRAAKAYYALWSQRFADRGLSVHTAPGDHELGDNNWRRDGNFFNRFKYRTVELFRRLYARNLVTPAGYRMSPASGRASATAYAVKLSPEVLLVTVDVWHKTDRGVVARLDDAQLRWLDRVLGRAQEGGVDFTIVQGHVPVLGPVRSVGSSGLFYDGGRTSPFWQTMRRHEVDLYLAGEVHDITARRAGRVTQITHGGLFGYGGTNYLLGEVRGDELSMVARRFDSTIDRSTELWQTDTRRNGPGAVTYEPDPPVVATMTITSDRALVERSGLLTPYRPVEGDARASTDPLPGVRE